MTDTTAKNDITGDKIITKRSTVYADNYAAIDWSKKDDHFNELLKDPVDGFAETKDANQ